MAEAHVIRTADRADAALVEGFRAVSAARVYEPAGQAGMMTPAICPVFLEARVCGPALTVRSHVGDNLMIHKAVTIGQPGDALVVTIANNTESGVWGEILTAAARREASSASSSTGRSATERRYGGSAFPSSASTLRSGRPPSGVSVHPGEAGPARVAAARARALEARVLRRSSVP